MTDALYHIIAIIVASYGVVKGYRRGLTGMVTSVLGLAFGIVCAHIFLDWSTEAVASILPMRVYARSQNYLCSNLGAGLVFFVVYSIFESITKIIRMAMSALGSGLLDSIIGAFFCVSNYLLMLSIVYNIIVGWNPDSALMLYGKADDGNIVEAVMWIAPAALGSESFGEFAHEEQLRQAKKISCNIYEDKNVLVSGGEGMMPGILPYRV